MDKVNKKEIAKRTLSEIINNPSECIVIHYARQSLYDNESGIATPRVIAIMLKSLDGQWNDCFAIHHEAEKAKILFEEIKNYYDLLEFKLLQNFNLFIKKNKNLKWIHWDMSDVHFSFEAIQHRFQVLSDGSNEEFDNVPHSKRINLNVLLKDIYGTDYEKDPKFEGLMKSNNKGEYFSGYMDNSGEALAFKDLKFPQILESLKVKVNFLIDVTSLSFNETLKVAKKYWANKLKGFITHPVTATISLVLTVLSILLKVFGVFNGG